MSHHWEFALNHVKDGFVTILVMMMGYCLIPLS